VPKGAESASQGSDFFFVKTPIGDQHPRVSSGKPLEDGLGSERGEERTEHVLVLQRSQGGHVELRDASDQGKDSFPLLDSQPAKDLREAIRLPAKIVVRSLFNRAAEPQEPKGDAVREGAFGVTVDRFESNVDSAPSG